MVRDIDLSFDFPAEGLAGTEIPSRFLKPLHRLPARTST